MDASATTRISRLQKMSLKELWAEYEKAFGKPTKSRNRKQLFAQIARKLQDPAEEPESAKRPVPLPELIAKYDPKKPSRSKRVTLPKKTGGKTDESRKRTHPAGARDPRLPKPGTTITREYKGKKILVRVLDEGFECDGKQYRSLSAVAMAITGAKAINGYLWFRLGQYAKKEKDGK